MKDNEWHAANAAIPAENRRFLSNMDVLQLWIKSSVAAVSCTVETARSDVLH